MTKATNSHEVWRVMHSGAEILERSHRWRFAAVIHAVWLRLNGWQVVRRTVTWTP